MQYFVGFIIAGVIVTYNLFLAVINGKFEDANKLVMDNDFGYDLYKIWGGVKTTFKRTVFGTSTNTDSDGSLGKSKPKPLPYTSGVRSFARFNHGDDELITTLKTFQEKKNAKLLTSGDLYSALGKPPEVILKRVMKRFDEDGSGTIELKELDNMKKQLDAEEIAEKLGKAVEELASTKAKEAADDSGNVDERLERLDKQITEMLVAIKRQLSTIRK